MAEPFLSIIIPAHNEERRLPNTLEQACVFIREQDYQAEVLVVENASQDRTMQIASEFASSHEGFRVFQEPQRGKGMAVRRGMLAARGAYRFMCDADFSMPIAQINRFLPPQLTDFDVAIASREAPGAIRYHEPAYRHVVGRLFNLLIRTIALPEFHDTQCGFKCLKAEAAEALFARQTLPGWSFDVEILFIARRWGYRIVELPVPWYFNADSKVSVLRDSFQMAVDLLKIRLNAIQGRYHAEI